MQHVARGWLVLRLSDSPFQLGWIGFLTFLPVLLFALPAGVVADRFSRRKMLVWTQGLAMLQSLLLAWLTFTGAVEMWHIGVIAFGMGAVGAFDIPIRQSLLQDLVGGADLPNAIALNSLAFNGARLLGPALAGLLLTGFGEDLVFLINGLSYLAVLTGILAMNLPPLPKRPERDSWLVQIAEGVRYARTEPRTRVILLLVVVSSVFAFPYSVLLPVFARDVLDVGSSGLGFLTSASGLGAMTGALLLAGRQKRLPAGRTIAAALALLAVGLIGFSQSTNFLVSLGMLYLVGLGMIVQMATSNTVLQLLAPAELRGRIISLYMLAFLGMSPFGSLLAGTTARYGGVANAVVLGGLVTLFASAWFATRIPALRAAVERHQSTEI